MNTQRRSIDRLIQGGQAGEFRAIVSQTGLLRKMHPGIPRLKRDALSQSRPYGKLRPTLKGKTGTQFPGGASKTKLRWNSSWMGWLIPQIETISPQVIEGLGCPSSYRWRSRKRKARRIQGRTAACLSSLSTAVLALPSERPWPPWSKTCISHATPSSAMRCANG